MRGRSRFSAAQHAPAREAVTPHTIRSIGPQPLRAHISPKLCFTTERRAMTGTLRKNATNTRGRPFKPGNAGRPKGARNRTTVAAEALLDGQAEALTRKAIERALGGDILALRICLDRILPARRDRS